MQIQLSQSDIEAAIRSHVKTMGIIGYVSSISLSTTRNPTGFKAEIVVGEPPATQAPEAQRTVHQATAALRPAGDKPEPEKKAEPDQSKESERRAAPELTVVDSAATDTAQDSPEPKDAEEIPQPRKKLFSQ